MRWLVSPLILSLTWTLAGYAAPSAPKAAPPQQQVKKTEVFKPFTGKVLANKVRIRAKADVDGHIIRQVNKNDLLLVIGEEGDFFAVQPPKDTKAYVFRSYVLDDIVEANRVNVRLEPHVDAPIIAQLQAGDKIQAQVCSMNHKWLEIAPPSSARFYVSKEFIAGAGGPEYLAAMEKRKTRVDELLSAAFLAAENECKKRYEEMSPHDVSEMFQNIVKNFSDFSDAAEQAKAGLALLKETYLQKKIAFLESKAELSSSAKEELLAKHKAENRELFADVPAKIDPELWSKRTAKKESSDSTRLWDAVEESLFLSWSAFHTGKRLDDFYAEQKANATVISGTLESYAHPIKNKPGNFILRGDAPIAYLYSTQVDLEKYVGKSVTLLVAPRPNNHFAFPAYYVLGVE